LARGLNTHAGRLASAPVAQARGYEAVSLADILSYLIVPNGPG